MRSLGGKAGGARRKLLVGAILLVCVVASLPYVAAPIVRNTIVERLERELDATATLEELSFGLGGRVHAGGFALASHDGRTIARAQRLDAHVSLLSALRGNYDLALDLQGFELHLWKRPDGTWNVAGTGGTGTQESTEESGERGEDALPSLRARVSAAQGTLVLHGEQGETALELGCSLDLESWDRPAPFELRVAVRGPDGPGGELRAAGSFAVADGGRRGARGASGKLALEIDALQAEALVPALTLVAPLEHASGRLGGRIALELAQDLALSGTLELELADVLVQPLGARALRAPDATLRGEASADASGAGRQTLQLDLHDLLAARYEGTLAEAEDGGRLVDGRLTLRGGLGGLYELARGFVALEDALALEGELSLDLSLRSTLERDTRPRTLELRGDLSATGLSARDASGAPVPLDALSGARLSLDAAADFRSGALELRALHADAGALDLDGNASLAGVPGLSQPGAALSVESSLWNVRADLGALRRDLALFLPAGHERLEGRLAARVEARGASAGPIRTLGEATIEALELEWPVGAETLRLDEPRVDLSFDAELETGATRRVAGSLGLVASLLAGELVGGLRQEPGASPEVPVWIFEDLQGAFTYVPDRLASVAGPWLPGRISGAAPERLDFRLSGRATSFAPEQLFASADASANVGIGSLELDGLTLGGELGLVATGGTSRLESRLTANGGSLELAGELGLAAGATTTPLVRLSAKDVQANSKLAPLLGRLHPAFASIQAVQGNAIGGLIETQLELTHGSAPGGSPLTLASLTSGGFAQLAQGLDGSGSFALSKASLRGSTLLTELLGELGIDAGKALDLAPIRFVIEKGRVSYEKPWEWKIDGVPTSFSGSIGLDRTLSMAWSIPVSEKLIAKHGFLSVLQGQTLEVPIGGTLTRPRLEVSGLLSQLAAKAAQGEIQKRLGGGDGGSDDPAEILRRADELWHAGQKVEAAALYEELHERHRVSLVYALNRDRIKERADYEPPK